MPDQIGPAWYYPRQLAPFPDPLCAEVPTTTPPPPFPLWEQSDEDDSSVIAVGAVAYGSRWVVVRLAETGGRVELVSVEVRSEPGADGSRARLRAQDMRIPFASIYHRVARAWYDYQVELAAGAARYEGQLPTPEFEDIAKRVSKEAEERLPAAAAGTRSAGGGRRPKYGEDHYRTVARVYAEHFAAGESSPTQAVKEHFGDSTTIDAARKWVARARKLGYLSDAPGDRQAGGTYIEEGEE